MWSVASRAAVLAVVVAALFTAPSVAAESSFGDCQVVSGAAPQSPGGRYLAYVGADGSSLVSARADGSHARTVYRGPVGRASVSPDGKLVAFQRGTSEVWIVGTDGSNPHFVAAGTSPSFSPDGRRLAIGGPATTDPFYELDVIDLDGANRHTVATDAVRYPQPSWSPDGKQIAFVSWTREQFFYANIKRVGSDGAGEAGVRIYGFSPAWSPDGRWIAYTDNGDRSLPSEVHIVHPDGSDDRLVTKMRDSDVSGGTWNAANTLVFVVEFPYGTAGPGGTTAAGSGDFWQVEINGHARHPLSPGCRFGTSRRDRIHGTARRDRIYTLEGDDVVDVRHGGRDLVDCGPGRDSALADRSDVVQHCERVVRTRR
jgi:Tol biopolymer transport system component